MKKITFTLVVGLFILLSGSRIQAQNSSNFSEDTPQLQGRDEPTIPQQPNPRELDRYISRLQTAGRINVQSLSDQYHVYIFLN